MKFCSNCKKKHQQEASIEDGNIDNNNQVAVVSGSSSLQRSPSVSRKTEISESIGISKTQRLMMRLRLSWNFFKAQFGQTKEKDGTTLNSEKLIGDVPSASKYIVLGLEGLETQTKFNRDELKRMYRSFKAECPGGLIDRETFLSVFSTLFPEGDSTIYGTRLFQSFDTENSGSISFEDLVLGLSRSLHGSVTEKLRWVFKMYDYDGNGYIGKEELFAAVHGLYALKSSTGENNPDLVSHVNDVFATLDLNDDGLITEDEFVYECSQNHRINEGFNSSRMLNR